MGDLKRRVLGYGATVAVLSALFWVGFVYEASADAGTLLSSADVQLRLATSMPAADEDGRAFEARETLLGEVKSTLEEIEKQEPGLAITREYRAYLAFLEGRFDEAAALYEEQRGSRECSPEMRDQSVINQARMLRMAGRTAEARTVLERYRGELDEPYADAARTELSQLPAGS